MALHWEEARVIVTCGAAADLDVTAEEDAIVILLKPEEVNEPETIEAVRNLVLDRTIERRRQTLSDVYELGTSLPEPLFDNEDGNDEATAAERAFLENLLEREESCGDGGAASGGEAPWPGSPLDPLGSGLMLGGNAGNGVRIFIGRVEELVVNN